MKQETMLLTPEEKNSTMSAERAFLTKLLESALHGNFEKLRQTVDEYCLKHEGITPTDVLSQFRDGQKRTALHFASQSTVSPGNGRDILEDIFLSDWLPASSVQSMLRMKDKDGLTPLMLAAQVSERKVAEKRVLTLLRVRGDTGKSDGSKTGKLGLARSHAGATPLHYASGAGASAIAITALYEAGQVAVNTFSLQGGTPLHWACAAQPPKDYTETIGALLDCGGDLNASKVDGSQMIPPPLVMALAAGNDRHAKYLVEEAKKRDIDIRSTLEFSLPGQLSPYHVAADMNMVGTLALLLEYGDKDDIVKLKDGRGLSPLDMAAREGHVGCVLLLLPNEKQTEEEARLYINKSKSQTVLGNEASRPPTAKDAAAAANDNEYPSSIETQAQSEAAAIAASASDITEEFKKKALKKKAEGNSHFAKNEWQAALNSYSEAISCDPADATFYSNRSACYMHLKRPGKALHDATIARSLRPEWPKAAYRMAVARLELGRFEDAALSAWEGLQQDQGNEELKRLLQKCVKKGRKDFLGAKA